MKQIVLSLLFLSNIALAKKTIFWLEVNVPPEWILEGESYGKGYVQAWQKMYKDALPEYNHEYLKVNVARWIKSIQNKEAIYCSALVWMPINDVIKTMDENGFYQKILRENHLSKIVDMKFGPGLITRHELRDEFLSYGREVSITNLIEKSKRNFIVVEGWLKLGTIDLNKYLDRKNVNLVSPNHPGSLIRMIDQKRADYTIYPPDLPSYVLGDKNFVYLPVKEFPGYFLMRSICSPTIEGKTIINKLNPIILRQREKIIKKSRLEWLPKSLHQKYQEVRSKAFENERNGNWSNWLKIK